MKPDSDHTLATFPHDELISLLVANPRDEAVAREFISRYDHFIRQTITSAVDKWMAAAGYERVQTMIEDLVNETYCRLFQNDCHVLRAFKCRYANSIFMEYLGGTTSGYEKAAIERHLSVCENCFETFINAFNRHLDHASFPPWRPAELACRISIRLTAIP